MIRLVEKELKNTAEKSGMNPDDVIRKIKKDSNVLKAKRMEISFSEAKYIYCPDTINVVRTLDKKKKIYSVKLEVSAEIFSDDENWILDFSSRFTKKLPLKVLDVNGENVLIQVLKSEFSGFDFKNSDSANDFQIKFKILFEFIECINQEIPLIPSAELTPTTNRRINDQKRR